VDSCSAVSLIHSRLVKPSNIDHKSAISIEGITEHSLKIPGKANVSFEIQGFSNNFTLSPYVVPNFKYDFLLGTDFGRRYKASVNMGEALLTLPRFNSFSCGHI